MGQATGSRQHRHRSRRVLFAAIGFAVLPWAASEEPTAPPVADEFEIESDDPHLRGDNPLDAAKIQSLIDSLDERTTQLRLLLNQSGRSYRELAQRRAANERQLTSLEDEIDRMLIRPRELDPNALDALLTRVREARAQANAQREACDRRAEEIWRLAKERDALALRTALLRQRYPATEELLTGAWEVTWMPGTITGTFYLDQSGALVSGQYKLGLKGSGSLQGTFVSGKLYLQRIDATRGRDAEIEGYLDPDGRVLRGTWQNFELVQGGLPRGQWMARRVH